MAAVRTSRRLLLYARALARGLFWLAVLGVLLYAPARYVYLNVPIMPFQPVCWSVNADWPNEYVEIPGRPSEAFVVGIFDLAVEYGSSVGIAGRQLRVPLYEWLSHNYYQGWDGFYRPRRFYRFLDSAAVAGRLYKMLEDEGVITDETMRKYRFLDLSSGEREWRTRGPDECGLMGNLVIYGRRYDDAIESLR